MIQKHSVDKKAISLFLYLALAVSATHRGSAWGVSEAKVALDWIGGLCPSKSMPASGRVLGRHEGLAESTRTCYGWLLFSSDNASCLRYEKRNRRNSTTMASRAGLRGIEFSIVGKADIACRFWFAALAAVAHCRVCENRRRLL